MAGDREKCLKAGCTDYLSKPVNRRGLLEIVYRYLNGTRAHLSVLPASAGVEAITTKLETTADDPDFLQLLPAFVSHLPDQVSQLLQLLEERNFSALAEVVHQLKGAGGLYGFGAITDRASHAEETIGAGGALEVVAAEVWELADLVRTVRGYDRERERKARAASSKPPET